MTYITRKNMHLLKLELCVALHALISMPDIEPEIDLEIELENVFDNAPEIELENVLENVSENVKTSRNRTDIVFVNRARKRARNQAKVRRKRKDARIVLVSG